jgi:hypothetical protein
MRVSLAWKRFLCNPTSSCLSISGFNLDYAYLPDSLKRISSAIITCRMARAWQRSTSTAAHLLIDTLLMAWAAQPPASLFDTSEGL